MSNKPDFEFFKGVSRPILFLATGLFLFFAAAVLIFILRNASADHIAMPDLVGKYYVDVHNNLTQSQIHVTIEKRKFNDQNPGLILYQSIPAGTPVAPRDKLYLTVNAPDPLLKMPMLVGIPLNSAKASVSRIAGNEDVYSLEVGAITYTTSDGIPPDTVIAQFPLSGDAVGTNQKVYLLVSRPADTLTKNTNDINIDDLKKQNISVLSRFFIQNKIDYRIREFVKTEPGISSGEVLDISKDQGGVYHLKVAYHKPEAAYINSYEQMEVQLKGEGTPCSIVINSADGGKNTIFETQKHAADEKINLMFYRMGSETLTGVCGEKKILNKSFKPDNLS